jgi:DNA-3-methyladenine glycosylase
MREKKNILTQEFFERPVLKVAEDLIGKTIVRKINGKTYRYMITETEAYDGIHDLACHASKGRTKRTEVMFGEAGVWYVYLVYGMHYMINIVTGKKEHPAAVLIRGVKSISGPGRVAKALFADVTFTGKKALPETGLWIESPSTPLRVKKIFKTPRIGIDYAGPIWSKKLWRFVLMEA